ncbi:hypothetical protein O181_000907 [Austropuccinia psidii MF-1]|uniref:Uncharacterized protein n=1 Tax=Austropuccinia psidii MF-1 TaxID=1389203 RepID=A0A9Q3B9S9_9BASI|nr:hypothetical protein [Austropuccinia psidii MF-1]
MQGIYTRDATLIWGLGCSLILPFCVFAPDANTAKEFMTAKGKTRTEIGDLHCSRDSWIQPWSECHANQIQPVHDFFSSHSALVSDRAEKNQAESSLRNTGKRVLHVERVASDPGGQESSQNSKQPRRLGHEVVANDVSLHGKMPPMNFLLLSLVLLNKKRIVRFLDIDTHADMFPCYRKP